MATAACRRWGLPELCDTVEVLTSELVTNALRHAHPPFTLHISQHGTRLHVEVTDASPVPPHPDPQPNPYRPGHLGLPIVDTLAAAWGHHPTGAGKTVWFELATH
jgi:anti-sigma regulatory factor (Ser/Thr protein kinase)